MDYKNLAVRAWKDYELIDSGGNRKLERYGSVTLIRPETQAIWAPSRPERWKEAQAEFVWSEGKGSWKKNKAMPASWELSWDDIHFVTRLTAFKHTGIFPEQAANWTWIRERVAALKVPARKPAILNLFGYTGIATLVAAKQGALVTHVDASKQSNAWLADNARLSGVEDGVRYILDDALKFCEREARRGASYEGIILDPPAFGRGAKGEVWRIEEDLPRLLKVLEKLLSEKEGSFFLLNGYASGYSPQSYKQAVGSFFSKNIRGEFGELCIEESSSDRSIPSGIYVRFLV